MSLDTGLMDRARDTREAVLRVYAWSRPTLSFGRHEAVRARFTPVELQRLGMDAVRRPTGGRVLLHDHEVTYSVTAPAGASESLRERYRTINALLLQALRRLGVQAEEADAPHRAAPTCFAAPNRGELVVDGRKLVGSAQLCERGAVLQHGSILVTDDQAAIALASGGRVPSPPPAATLEQCLGRSPSYATVRDALIDALLERHPDSRPLAAAEAAPWGLLHQQFFADAEWTWRR